MIAKRLSIVDDKPPPATAQSIDMHPSSLARRILKWTGAGLSLVVLATWIASLWWQAIFVLPGGHGFSITTYGGTVLGFSGGDARMIHLFEAGTRAHNWFGFGFDWPELFISQPFAGTYASGMLMPFWLLLLLIAIPTAWLWHRDRRRIRPGHCPRCGYDLTGNTSGICSECGEPKPPPATA